MEHLFHVYSSETIVTKKLIKKVSKLVCLFVTAICVFFVFGSGVARAGGVGGARAREARAQ